MSRTKNVFISILLIIICFIIAFVIGLSLVSPLIKKQNVKLTAEDLLFSLRQESATDMNDCKIENGKLIATGADPYIVFDCTDKKVSTVNISLSESSLDSSITTYIDKGEGFKESEILITNLKDNRSPIFAFENQCIRQIRFDFEKEIKIESVDFYSSSIIKYNKIPIKKAYYFIISAVSLLISLIVLFIQQKTKFINKVFLAVKNNIKSILLFCSGLLFSEFIAFIAAYFIGRVKGSYNSYLFFFIFAIFAVIFEILFFSKNLSQKTENLFLAICLTVGITMIIITPIGHVCWDTETHYRYTLSTTSNSTVYSNADKIIIKNQPISFASSDLEENIKRNIFFNDQNSYKADTLAFDLHITHFFSGVALKLARFLGFSFTKSFLAGKIPNLLIYAFVCYFAIKKLKSGKMIMSVIALFPTALFLSTNYAYDGWVICFSLLGISYYCSELQEPLKPIDSKSTLIMCGALFLACLPKAVYLTFLFIPMFMPPKKIPNKIKYYITCAIPFVCLFIIMLLKALSSVSGGGDTRGGATNPGEQLSFILSEPISFAKILIKFLLTYLSIGQMYNYISNFAYLGIGPSSLFFIIPLIALGIIDKNERDVYSSKFIYKIISVIFLVGTAAMIASALYIDFTPPRAETIAGCQSRYIIPLIFPVVFFVGSSKKLSNVFAKINHNAIYFLSFILCSCGLFIDTFATTMTKML